MGKTPSTALTRSETGYNPDLTRWEIVGEGDTYNIWRNRDTSEEMEEYTQTSSNEADFRYFRDVFEFRFDRDYIVSSVFFKEEARQEMCSTFYYGSIFLERIPLRLNEIKDLPFPDSVHLIHNCLRGFRELYNRVGSFTVSQQMIGINAEAKVKVWIIGDFCREKLTDMEVIRHDEAAMVVEILEIADKSIDHRTEPESLTQYLIKGQTPTFEQALRRLQEYTIRYVVQIPPFLTSIAQLRDRGYFKKMPPLRRTVMSQSQLSILDTGASQFQTESPFVAGANSLTVPQFSPYPQQSVGALQQTTTHNNYQLGASGHPTEINGVSVVQVANNRVNTFYSNNPVGGSFLLNRDQPRNPSPIKPLQSPLLNTNVGIPTSAPFFARQPFSPVANTTSPPHVTSAIPHQRPPGPVATTLLPAQRQPFGAPIHNPNHPLPATPLYPRANHQLPTHPSLHSQAHSHEPIDKSLSQVERILEEIKSLQSNKISSSGYVYQPQTNPRDYQYQPSEPKFQPIKPALYQGKTNEYQYKSSDYNQRQDNHYAQEYSQVHSYNYDSLLPTSSYQVGSLNYSSSSSYLPDSQGRTNPELLKLANIDRSFKSEHTQIVNSSYTSPPQLEVDSLFNASSQNKPKSILKNKNGLTSLKSIAWKDVDNGHTNESIGTSKPLGSEETRTIYNHNTGWSGTGGYSPVQHQVKKEVETYRAHIKIHTPEEARKFQTTR